MDNPLTLLKGLAVGAGMMYLFDPRQGRRRRALVRDQVVHLSNELEDFIEEGVRDLSNRAQGTVAEARAMVSGDEASDAVVVDRVRSALGRLVSHPRSLKVRAMNGHVTISGPILADEVERLIAGVSSIRGVRDVEDRLEVHAEPGAVPALQGGRAMPSSPMGGNWSPGTRLLAGAAGTYVALKLVKHGGLPLVALGLVGAGLATGKFGDLSGMGEMLGEWVEAGRDRLEESPLRESIGL